MSADPSIEEIVVLPRVISETGFVAPSKTRYVRQASRGLKNFLARSVLEAGRVGTFNLVYCAHINLLPVAAAISWFAGCPLVLTIYGTDGWEKPKSRLTTTAMPRVSLLISISRLTLDRFLSWGPRLNGRKAIVPNVIRLEKYALGAKSPELVEKYGLSGRRVIMTLGRMDPAERAKGFDEIIELMPRIAQHSPDIVYL